MFTRNSQSIEVNNDCFLVFVNFHGQDSHFKSHSYSHASFSGGESDQIKISMPGNVCKPGLPIRVLIGTVCYKIDKED